MKLTYKILFTLFLGLAEIIALNAQKTVRYTGSTLSNVDYHHGELSPVVGVHNIQVFRANREHPELADGFGWTYNHAPMLAYHNNMFYLEYLSDSVGESVPPGHTLLLTSKDGYHWSKPVVVFPKYKIPEGTVKTTEDGEKLVAHDLYSVMHQRMGFYVSKKNRFLVLGYYGICMNKKDGPNDGNGIGRVVREIYNDGTWGPIYFIHYNHNWDVKNTAYTFYTSSKDKGFVEACNELMANPLMMMQWVEESDRNDPLIPLNKPYKAFSFYHLSGTNRVVGLWKHALSTISEDGGKTWNSASRAPGFVNSSAKIWGQQTSDGKFATVYNPSEYRWPLAISTSTDGLEYTDLLLVNGEISSMRYTGNEKSYGPQYVRGILEGNGTPPGGNLWVTYSMNKEDMWVSEIPVPVTNVVTGPVNDDFSTMPEGREMDKWNVFSPMWAPVSIKKNDDGSRCLQLSDRDPYDYACVSRTFPVSSKGSVEFTVSAAQADHGTLQIELQNEQNLPSVRIIFDDKGMVWVKNGAKNSGVIQYKANEDYRFIVSFDTKNRDYSVNVNGSDKKKNSIFFAPAKAFDKIMFRTGERRYFPNADTPAEQPADLPNAGESVPEATYFIKSLKTVNDE